MIDIIVLAGFVYLVVRVANGIFRSIDSLTSRKQQPKAPQVTESKKKVASKNESLPDWMQNVLNKQVKDAFNKSQPPFKPAQKVESRPEVMIKVEQPAHLKVSTKKQERTERVSSSREEKSHEETEQSSTVKVNKTENVVQQAQQTQQNVTRSEVKPKANLDYHAHQTISVAPEAQSTPEDAISKADHNSKVNRLQDELRRSEEKLSEAKQGYNYFLNCIEDINKKVINSQVLSLDEEEKHFKQSKLVNLLKREINRIQYKGDRAVREQASKISQLERDNLALQEKYYNLERSVLITEKAQARAVENSDSSSNQQVQEIQRQLIAAQHAKANLSQEVSSANKERDELKKAVREKDDQLRAINEQVGSLNAQVEALQVDKKELHSLKEKWTHLESQKTSNQIKFESQIKSLTQQRNNFQQDLNKNYEGHLKEQKELKDKINELEEEKFKLESELEGLKDTFKQAQSDRNESEGKSSKIKDQLADAQRLLKEKTQEASELQHELELSKKKLALEKAQKMTLTEIEKHPEFIKMKRRVEQAEGKETKEPSEKAASNDPKEPAQVSPPSRNERKQYGKSYTEREPSPLIRTVPIKTPEPKFKREQVQSKIETSSGHGQNKSESRKIASSIYAGTHDIKPKFERVSPVRSAINPGDHKYFEDTGIMSAAHEEFIITKIIEVKKIGVKRTKLLHHAGAISARSIIDLVAGIPNIIVVVELESKHVVGAFTQAAFTKQQAKSEARFISHNKSLLIDFTSETVIKNHATTDTIHLDSEDPNTLIWGRDEFVLRGGQRLEASANMNCEAAIYPWDGSSEKFLGGKNVEKIVGYEIYRLFFG